MMRKRRGRKQYPTAKQRLDTFLNKARNRRVFKGQRESQKRTKPEDKDRRRRLLDLAEDEEQEAQENDNMSSTAFVSFGGRGKANKRELGGNTLREMAMLQRMSQNRSDLVGSQQLLSEQERIFLRAESGGPQLFLQPKFLTAGVATSSKEKWGRLLKDREESFGMMKTLTPYYGKYLRALEPDRSRWLRCS